MCTRALFIYNWRRLTTAHLAFIQEQSTRYEELIFLVNQADTLPARAAEAGCGELMAQLQQVFNQRLEVPFYILPVPAKGMTAVHDWLRWRILCPAFEQVFIDIPDMQWQMQTILHKAVEYCPFGNSKDSFLPATRAPVSRGLFITRAQPFHNGHLAFIEQMRQEVSEIIVVIAMANRSHQVRDIAMAGERLAMVGPELHKLVRGRHYLAALPYSDFSMENLYELEYLLPPFQVVYTTNPSVKAMAATAGYETRSLHVNLPVSSTLIRECMLRNQPYDQYVPPGVHRLLQETGMAERLKTIMEKEKR